jgi:branched-chain amino acid transport system ATP-binding protein
MNSPLLSAQNVTSGFGDYQVLWGISIDVAASEIVAILGPNGCGKSTLMASISGVHPAWSGRILLDQQDVALVPPHKRVALGISHVLERRRLFGYMSVRENLLLGAVTPEAKKSRVESEEWVLSLFPILRDRTRQMAGTMSGGEQQMLAIARGLMAQPKLLLLDEPLIGLSPAQVTLVGGVITQLRTAGVAVLFVEQNVPLSLSVADRCVLLRGGQVVYTGSTESVSEDDVMAVYMGEEFRSVDNKGVGT